MGTITVFALKKKKKPKGKEGTTRAVAANVIRPETAPLAVGLWSKMEKRWAISLPSSFRVSRHLPALRITSGAAAWYCTI